MIQEGKKVKEKDCKTKIEQQIAKKNKNQQKKKKVLKIKINRKEGRRKNN